jgi:hypothetical protein
LGFSAKAWKAMRSIGCELSGSGPGRGIFRALFSAMYGFSTALRALPIALFPQKSRPCLLLLALIALAAFPLHVSAQVEETFPLLTIGTRTYTNVTVTTKTKKYVMLMHSQGLANVKVSELPADLRETLGYNREEPPKSKTEAATKWAKAKLAVLNVGDVKATEQNLRDKWAQQSAAHHLPPMPELNQRFFLMLAGILVALFIVQSALLRLVVQNAGKEPGPMIWLPFLQVFPSLKAASMSPAWVLGLPVGITVVVWCFKISGACGKSAFTGLCLLFPLTSPFALLYLAFSGDRPESDPTPTRRPQIMTLETA